MRGGRGQWAARGDRIGSEWERGAKIELGARGEVEGKGEIRGMGEVGLRIVGGRGEGGIRSM